MPTSVRVLCCGWYAPLVEGLLSLLSLLGKATSPQEVESLSPASEWPTRDIQLLNQKGKIGAKKNILNSAPNSAFLNWVTWTTQEAFPTIHPRPPLHYQPLPLRNTQINLFMTRNGQLQNHFLGITYLSNHEIIDSVPVTWRAYLLNFLQTTIFNPSFPYSSKYN